MPETNLTHDLLRDIEIKDRRFRFAQTLFFFLVAFMLVVLLIGSWRQETDNQKVIAGQTETLKTLSASSKQRTTQINDLQKHIDCIVALFQQPNRTSLVISDIENCSLKSLETSNTSQTTPFNPMPAPSNNQSSTPQIAPPATSSNGSGGSTTPPQQPDPITVLGIPICVPLTHVCAR